MKTIEQAEIAGKNIFLRVDFNVPMNSVNSTQKTENSIADDNRIDAALPTINYLLENGASKITIGSHLGKPAQIASQNEAGRPTRKNNSEFSLWPVANRLAEKLNIDKKFDGPAERFELNERVMLLENLRFNSGEEKDDEEYAKELAAGQDIYINDAFAVSHRANASVHAITKFLPGYAGLLIQKEISELTKVMTEPKLPFILIIGGVKIEDKAGVIEFLAPKVDKILLGGGVANTFLKASGLNIGDSVYDETMVERCKEILKKYGEKIVLPTDFVRNNGKILDIGAETQKKYVDIISGVKTVFWNGNLGYTEDNEYANGSRVVAEALSNINAETVIAGGDTVGFVKSQGLDKNITFISTGGGAALEFLAGKELPGIEVLQ
ncbi:MAG: phosphoglycerate kinase [Candidatus Berkelbacteria bacterium]